MPLANKNLTEQIGLPIRDYAYTAVMPIPPEEMLYKDLTIDGVPGASEDMNVNGSVTPVSFRYTAPAGKVAIPHRVMIMLADVNIEYLNFAGLGLELTNGIVVRIMNADDTVAVDLTNGHPIASTHEFATLAGGDVVILSTGIGVDPDFIAIQWTLAKSGYVPYLTAGQYLEILIRDDLLLVDHMHAFVQGRIVSPTV